MNLTYKLINAKSELHNYKAQIQSLFFNCFEKDIGDDLWMWAYVHNPLSDPIVSLCFDGSKLVGHYAVIPFSLSCEGSEIRACLSMTTMVDVEYRRFGIFKESAEQVYSEAEQAGCKLVIGFPNQISLPGFRKRLQWQFGPVDYVAKVTKWQLMKSKYFEDHVNNRKLIALNTYNNEFLQWRLSKPGCVYHSLNDLIIKDIKNEKDIVYIGKLYKEVLENERTYNILIDGTIDELREFQIFEYPFGYRALDCSFNGAKFKKDLLLSDVF